MPQKAPRRPASIKTAAEHAECNPRTIYRWIQAGLLPAYRLGPKFVRVDLDDLDQLARPIAAASAGNE